MEAIVVDKSAQKHSALTSLRAKASTLAMKSEDESVLEQVIALLSGMKRPCAYTHDEMAANLLEADEDYKAGRFVTQDELRTRYGL